MRSLNDWRNCSTESTPIPYRHMSTMQRVELITVEHTFYIARKGLQMLILHPDFSVPPGGWKNITQKVLVVKPDGQKIEAIAEITLQHLNIPEPAVSIDQRWRVGMYLKEVAKDSAYLHQQQGFGFI